MLLWIFRKLLKVVRHSLFLSLLFCVSVCLTIVVYCIFYNWYLPKAKLQRHVLFELENTIYKLKSGQEFMQPELVGYVNLFNDPSETLHYGQEYSITLHMDLPESDFNFEIGMFGVTLEVVDINGQKSAGFKTMGTLVYKSKLLRYLTTLVYFPFYLIGRFEQKQVVDLVLKDSFIDNSYMRANKFIIRLHEKVQLYSVQLILEAKFTGLKYYLHNWYYTTTMIIGLCLLSMIFVLMLSTFFDLKSVLTSKKTSNKEIVLLKTGLMTPFNDDLDDNQSYYDTTTEATAENSSCETDDSNQIALAPRSWFAEYERNILRFRPTKSNRS